MFERDEKYAEWAKTEPWWGEYEISYKGASGLVVGYLFRKDGKLVAHVNFRGGSGPHKSPDPYWGDIHQYAREHGFADKTEIIYSITY